MEYKPTQNHETIANTVYCIRSWFVVLSGFVLHFVVYSISWRLDFLTPCNYIFIILCIYVFIYIYMYIRYSTLCEGKDSTQKTICKKLHKWIYIFPILYFIQYHQIVIIYTYIYIQTYLLTGTVRMRIHAFHRRPFPSPFSTHPWTSTKVINT